MHPYSIVEDARRRLVVLACAALGAGLAFAVAALAGAVGLTLPWWVDAPGLLGGFGLVWKGYDAWGWKLRWLSRVPDFSGVWDGHVYSDYQGRPMTAATLTIQQTATRIQIHLRTGISRSVSTMALVAPGGDGGDELHYSYSNTPGTAAEATMYPHDGWADLRLTKGDGELVLAGDYENNRHRRTTGQVKFRRSR